MKWINRIAISAWLLITLVLVYATWNPTGYSLYHYIGFSTGMPSARVLVAIVLLAVYAIYLHETYRTFNAPGLVIFTGIICASLWFAADLGLLQPTSVTAWQWLTPAIFAIVLWLGLQGGRMYRNATGRVPVSVDHHHADTVPPGDHHGQA